MATGAPPLSRIAVILRWLALIVGALFVVFVIVMNVLTARASEELAPTRLIDVLQGLGMLATMVGVFLGWKWPLLGAGLIFGGYGFFEAVTYVKVGHFAGRLFLIFLGVGVVYLVIGWQRRRRA